MKKPPRLDGKSKRYVTGPNARHGQVEEPTTIAAPPPVPRARNTGDYCDGVVGLVAASSGGLREPLLAAVFAARAGVMDGDSRKGDADTGKLVAVLRRLADEGRLVLVDAAERRWATPAQAAALGVAE